MISYVCGSMCSADRIHLWEGRGERATLGSMQPSIALFVFYIHVPLLKLSQICLNISTCSISNCDLSDSENEEVNSWIILHRCCLVPGAWALLCLLLRALCLADFDNSNMGWGAAHTQEFRWVEEGPDTHACEVSFHPLAGIQWGGQHQTNEGATWLPPGQRHALPSS